MLTILCLSQESWLLEGRLAPWVHYAPVRPDFKDVSTTYYTVYNITVTDSEAHTHSLQKRFNALGARSIFFSSLCFARFAFLSAACVFLV